MKSISILIPVFVILEIFISCEEAEECTLSVPVKSLEEEYGCTNTKYNLEIDLENDYTIVRSQEEFNSLVSGTCKPAIDFSTYDLVIGKKQLTTGNASIEYKAEKDCSNNRITLLYITFNQNNSLVAPNLTYHAMIPKLGDEETVEVKIEPIF